MLRLIKAPVQRIFVMLSHTSAGKHTFSFSVTHGLSFYFIYASPSVSLSLTAVHSGDLRQLERQHLPEVHREVRRRSAAQGGIR